MRYLKFILKENLNIKAMPGAFHGNCGMYAYALAEVLKEKGYKNIKLGFLTKNDIDTKDLEGGDYDLYHVIVVLNKSYYDGDGLTNIDNLLELCEKEYNDSNPSLHTIGLTEKKYNLLRIIRNNTNYSKSWEFFYKKLKERLI